MAGNERLDQFLRHVAEQRFYAKWGNWGTPRRFGFYLSNLFKGINLTSKRILDVGAGVGAFSVYMALRGAEFVYALEPECDGSQQGMQAKFDRLVEQLAISNVRLDRRTLEQVAATLDVFDVVLLHNCHPF